MKQPQPTAVPEHVRDLEGVGRTELASMLEAGREVRECLRVLGNANLNLVGECLRGQGTFYELDHYPEGDVYDHVTHAQYYYHAHRGTEGEHGHFHTFVRARGMPEGVQPVAYEGDEPWREGDEVLSHLVAISMDRLGLPVALFTTNRWVTGESWFHAHDVERMLDRFRVDHAYPSWPLNRWLGAMVVLFRPTVVALLRERDAALEDWRARHPEGDAFEDRTLEIMSRRPIDIETQIGEVERRVAAT
jgi:hypothetical protein